MRQFAITLLIALMAMVQSASAQGRGALFDPAGCNPRVCSESGWIYDDNRTSHTTIWRHDLGVTPRRISILFSPDPDQRRVIPLAWSWTIDSSGNPTSVEMGRRAVQLHIWNGAPLHGVWRPDTGWEKYSEGYWKIMVYR